MSDLAMSRLKFGLGNKNMVGWSICNKNSEYELSLWVTGALCSQVFNHTYTWILSWRDHFRSVPLVDQEKELQSSYRHTQTEPPVVVKTWE